MKRRLPKVDIVEADLAHQAEVNPKDQTLSQYYGYVAANAKGRRARIVIEENQPTVEYLNSLIHELLHVAHPDWSEAHVTSEADWLTIHLWRSTLRQRILRNPENAK